MTVYVQVKALGKKRPAVQALPISLPYVPTTAGELISLLARQWAGDYNIRLNAPSVTPALTAEDMADMAQVGKIAFGMLAGSAPVDIARAADTAMEAYRDGLVRLFIHDTEPESPDAPITLKDGDSLTLLRLVMLTGGWF